MGKSYLKRSAQSLVSEGGAGSSRLSQDEEGKRMKMKCLFVCSKVAHNNSVEG